MTLTILIVASHRKRELRLDVGQSFGDTVDSGPQLEQPMGHLGERVDVAKALLHLEQPFLVGPLARVE